MDCLVCRDGSVVCGKPPKCGGDPPPNVVEATTGSRLERIEITASYGALKVESTPSGFDFGEPTKIVMEYANPADPADGNVLIRFLK